MDGSSKLIKTEQKILLLFFVEINVMKMIKEKSQLKRVNKLSRKHGILFIETSAKTNTNIEEMFTFATRARLELILNKDQ